MAIPTASRIKKASCKGSRKTIISQVRVSMWTTVFQVVTSKDLHFSIIIAHENGLFTRYAHLASESVSKGDTVAKGQTIGTVGDTGAADFPQLHFEVIRDGKTVDPMQYFEK